MTPGSPSSDSPEAPPGPLPEAVLAAIEAHLQEREQRREELYQRARRLRRLAQATVARLHAHGAAPTAVAAVRQGLAELAGHLADDRRTDAAIAVDALQEAVEACVFGAIVASEPLPSPTDLGVAAEPYLLGLGDVVGELRRLLLDRLGHDDVAGAERYLALMDGLVRALVRFDPVRAIVALKPKQDVARSLLERSRGEVVMARALLRARPTGRQEAP